MATGGKAVRFEVSGITAGNTRVLTVPDKNGIIALDSDLFGNIDGGKPGTNYGGALTVSGGDVNGV